MTTVSASARNIAGGVAAVIDPTGFMMAAPVPLVLFDAETHPVFANDAYHLLLGGHSAAAGGIPDYRDCSEPADRARHDVFLRQLLTGHLGSFRIELLLHCRDGRDRSVLVDGAPSPAGDGMLLISLTDVTALRRHREVDARRHDALDQALEEMSAGLVLFDAEDRLVFCNRRYREFYGVPDNLARPGARFADMLLEELRSGNLLLNREEAQRFVETRLARRTHEGQIVEQRNRHGRWLQIRERVIPGGWVVGVHVDATELKEKEDFLNRTIEALRETRAQLESGTQELSDLAERLAGARDEALAAARAKANFLANMSHELRTPLNAVIGFAELLASGSPGPLTPRQSDYLEDIRRSGSHLLGVINDILDLSKADAGKIELDEEEILMAEFLGSTGRLMAATAKAKPVDFLVEFGDDMSSAVLHADRRRLRQVLLNLLSNAIKFTEPGGCVTMEAAIGPDGDLFLTISDTGIGIAPEDMAKVFAPFEQADGSLARKYEGTGLGMALVKALVELHGGSVTLNSHLGHGTRVAVVLPARRLRWLV